MLVLSRTAGEAIVIDKAILVKVVAIQDGVVRLGIEAPPHIIVDRLEVHVAKERHPRQTPADHQELGTAQEGTKAE